MSHNHFSSEKSHSDESLHGKDGHSGHGHHHHHSVSLESGTNRAFAIAVILNVLMATGELIFGFFANSMALIADAGHNYSDVLGILMAWGAAWLSTRHTSRRFTYGYRRSTILAALFSGLLLLIASGAIAWEAIDRLVHPSEVNGLPVIIVAAIGIVVNGISAWLFLSGSKEDLNLRGALFHLAGDAVVSLGVVVSGLLMVLFQIYWVDSLASLGIVMVILVATWSLLRDSLLLSLDAVPPGIDPEKVREALTRFEGVERLHDLHIWPLSTTRTALTAHLVAPGKAGDNEFLNRISRFLREEHKIHHTTIQVESGDICGQEEECLLDGSSEDMPSGHHHH